MGFIKNWLATIIWVASLIAGIALTWTQYGSTAGLYATLIVLGVCSALYDLFGVR